MGLLPNLTEMVATSLPVGIQTLSSLCQGHGPNFSLGNGDSFTISYQLLNLKTPYVLPLMELKFQAVKLAESQSSYPFHLTPWLSRVPQNDFQHQDFSGYWWLPTPVVITIVLIRITGTGLTFRSTRHLFTTTPRGRLWWVTCLTKHIVLNCGLQVVPCTLMVELPGTEIGCFYSAYYHSLFSFPFPQKICPFLGGLLPFGVLFYATPCWPKILMPDVYGI